MQLSGCAAVAGGIAGDIIGGATNLMLKPFEQESSQAEIEQSLKQIEQAKKTLKQLEFEENKTRQETEN